MSRLSVSVALLLPGTGSVVPTGGVTVAVFTNVPTAVDATLATTLKVAVPLTARLTVVLRLPVPLAALQLEPPVATQLQLALVMAAGKVSATVAPVTALGPALVTTMV